MMRRMIRLVCPARHDGKADIVLRYCWLSILSGTGDFKEIKQACENLGWMDQY
jgi:hypothetical protein